MGRNASGVKGINLASDDAVIAMNIDNHTGSQLLVIGENGYGKRTKCEDFRMTRRAAKGVISMNITEKTGKVVGMLSVSDSQDLVVMTAKGILIRQQVSDIRTLGRNTQGVKLIRLDDGDSIADITAVNRDDDDINKNEYQNPPEETEESNQDSLFENDDE